MANYLPSTAAERQEMLEAIGCSSYDDLYRDVPGGANSVTLDLPAGMTEMEVLGEMAHIAAKNTVFHMVFRGAGSYNHYIPQVVKAVTSNEKFVTAYTPYQAEISQGVLQSIFEYQSMVCELTGMDASNASVYDGATAAAEAVFMCEERKRSGVVISETVNPDTIETVKTYCASRSVEVTVVPAVGGVTDAEAFAAALGNGASCAIIQQPNYFGILEDVKPLIDAAHAVKAKAIMSVNPISLGILATPGELGADICVAEGQPLGMPMAFGGPYLGIMTCTSACMRKLPGRIVGLTTDHDGNSAYVLTLQAREQHIRREKASSNICSNEALCALTASVYMAAMGPQGIEQAAKLSYSKAHYLAEQLCAIDGFELAYDQPFFNEVLIKCPCDPKELEAKLAEKGILAGLPIGESMLWCTTELNTKGSIDYLVEAVKEAM
ncbi:MAG: aminomethyl-transferring glycine dehydrogenase subunit GcvPA [Coriobacteriales bacterium]|nr:aminomethyl-transferring glycine dehydrogenase subunit GcvPA [Coriobacteriales bacterium]